MVRPLSSHTVSGNRRGVLLLVVLSMLTLFLMLGTTYLVVSSRARRTAKAFADSNVATSSSGGSGDRFVDQAFMAVARGTVSGSTSIKNGDDLLGDRYGTTTETGRISGSVSGTTILSIPYTGPAHPELLAGRVLTLTLPGLSSASTRIIRATANTLFIPEGRTVSGEMLSAATINTAKAKASGTADHFLVNGREFDDSGKNEPYDAFDVSTNGNNPFLANLSTGTSGTFSYGITGGSATIDNDGDGRLDSGWIDVGFPVIADVSGQVYQPKAAVLVIDLDGRINVNAHGSRADLENEPADYPAVTLGSSTTSMLTLPRGQGLGPAEVNVFASGVLGGTTAASGTSLAILLGGNQSIRGTDSVADSATSRNRPNIDKPEGRYGDWSWSPTLGLADCAKPGTANVDDNRQLDRWVSSSGTTRFFEDVLTGSTTRYGSPPDLKGRMRIWIDPASGQPVYYKPAWTATTSTDYANLETFDDPYELDLGPNGPRPGWVHDPRTMGTGTSTAKDNLFTPTELEGLLRYFDPDSMKLPRRLVTLSGSNAGDNRSLATTDSWDTPAVVGKAWRDVLGTPFGSTLSNSSAAAGSRSFDLFAPETIMGHKLDLNRPFHTTQYDEPNDATGSRQIAAGGATDPTTGNRQQFAKHLYCLLMAIVEKNKGTAATTTEAEQLAQWAVNIVDFRDADSIMTPFDYDETFSKGTSSWNPTRRVWGCERPEIVITEALAWHDRRTEDLDNPAKQIVDKDLDEADNDFDQRLRPRGAFFVELYSPWGSAAKQLASGTVADVTAISSTDAYRGEPLPEELTALSTNRFRQDATITLSLRHDRTTTTGTASPVWRLVSVRGDVRGSGSTSSHANTVSADGFGADPVRPVANGSLAILDPARPNSLTGSATFPAVATGSAAVIDRIFYFATPPSAQINEKPGAVFWQSGSATAEPSRANFVTIGTNRLLPDYSAGVQAGGTNAIPERVFDQPASRPATVSEPTRSGTTGDAYDGLIPGVTVTVSGTEALSAVQDAPLDSLTIHPEGFSQPFLNTFRDADGNSVPIPVLMQNGVHPNFAVVHLQRLANPTQPWDASTNPYLTVDSMPVDLTVVNTSGASPLQSYDEPGRTPSASPLTWLQSQKAYLRGSVERGGKLVDQAGPESDIWSRKVLANGSSALDALTFRSDIVGSRPVTTFKPGNGVTSGSIAPTVITGLTNTFGSKPERFTTTRYPWLTWLNRPFVSAAELSLVPTTSSFHLPALHTTSTTSGSGSKLAPAFAHLPLLLESSTTTPWNLLATQASGTTPGILDFVHVPTRFGGSYATLSLSNTTVLQAHGLERYPSNHLSLFREPGRVNVNTITTTTSGTAIWTALFGTGTMTSGSLPPVPAGGNVHWRDALGNNLVDTASDAFRNSDLDAYFRYQTAGRFSNVATTRSNVFAVWVTIGYFDPATGLEKEPLRRNRGFYIFDRSIPVGYERGKDYNVRDAILLRRIIE